MELLWWQISFCPFLETHSSLERERQSVILMVPDMCFFGNKVTINASSGKCSLSIHSGEVLTITRYIPHFRIARGMRQLHLVKKLCVTSYKTNWICDKPSHCNHSNLGKPTKNIGLSILLEHCFISWNFRVLNKFLEMMLLYSIRILTWYHSIHVANTMCIPMTILSTSLNVQNISQCPSMLPVRYGIPLPIIHNTYAICALPW